jgi:hypothetical protein
MEFPFSIYRHHHNVGAAVAFGQVPYHFDSSSCHFYSWQVTLSLIPDMNTHLPQRLPPISLPCLPKQPFPLSIFTVASAMTRTWPTLCPPLTPLPPSPHSPIRVHGTQPYHHVAAASRTDETHWPPLLPRHTLGCPQKGLVLAVVGYWMKFGSTNPKVKTEYPQMFVVEELEARMWTPPATPGSPHSRFFD